MLASAWGAKLTGESDADDRVELAPPPNAPSIAALAADHAVAAGADTLEASKAILAKLAQI